MLSEVLVSVCLSVHWGSGSSDSDYITPEADTRTRTGSGHLRRLDIRNEGNHVVVWDHAHCREEEVDGSSNEQKATHSKNEIQKCGHHKERGRRTQVTHYLPPFCRSPVRYSRSSHSCCWCFRMSWILRARLFCCLFHPTLSYLVTTTPEPEFHRSIRCRFPHLSPHRDFRPRICRTA